MSAGEKKAIKVLIVEDSRVVAEFLTHVLSADRRFQVVGVAEDGEAAVEAVQRTRPDVVTMDIHLPKVNGFEATRKIMETSPVPIVIVSGSVNVTEMAVTFRAVEAGAVAVVQRPNFARCAKDDAAIKELVDTVKLMSEVKVVRRWARSQGDASPRAVSQVAIGKLWISGPQAVQAVAIGASTGGPLVLQTVLARLPKNFPLPLLLVQHMAPGFAEGFVEWLANSSGYPVRVAREGDVALPRHAYLAPDDAHMGVRPGHRIFLSKAAREHGVRPSVSFLFRSVEQTFGANAVGVLLTGMGKDGAQELKGLREAGAVTIVQDEDSSIVHGMPGEAIQIGAARHVLPPQAIAAALTEIAATL